MRDHEALSTCNVLKWYKKKTRSSVIGNMDYKIPLSSSHYTMTSTRKKNRHATFKIQMKKSVYLLKHRMMHCFIIGKKTCLFTAEIKGHDEYCSGYKFSSATWAWNGARWSSWWLQSFEIGYCDHPASPYANIKLKQATKLILSNFWEEYHPLLYDNLNNKKKKLVWLYFVYRSKKKHLEQI